MSRHCPDCGQDHGRADDPMPPLYDVDAARRRMRRARRKRDSVTTATATIADRLATHLSRHFAAEEWETAARALIIASASVAALTDVPPELLCNVLAFAGDRLVTDGLDEVPGGAS